MVDTVRNVVGDKYAIFKLAIMSVPVFIIVMAYVNNHLVVANTMNIVCGVFFAAIFFETMRRSCTSEPMIMPSFMFPAQMLITLGLTIVASLPVIAVCGALAFVYFKVLELHPEIQEEILSYSLFTAVFLLLGISIFFAGATQYINSGKILDSYNPVKVMKSLSTFIANLLLLIIQEAIFLGLFGFIPINLIAVVMGFNYDNIVVYAYSSFLFSLNFVMLADYIAQTKKESECY